ncbi:shikimate dehydrogenase family protein [Ottowia sp. VDI28]|uniref:shikimate dehydrogenase family protein n=1 Tax=Ottowia sp. VDI28 TaxID=3133968 RepID=UPI003C3070C4
MIGSVNTVARRPDGSLVGDNVDGQGYLDGLAKDGIDVRSRRVLQFGAGGAGRAVAFSLASAGVGELVIRNRNMGRAVALAQEVIRAYPECVVSASDRGVEEDVREANFIVNTTSQGMGVEDKLLFDYSMLAPHQIVSDIIMVPEMTPLLKAAKDAGCVIALGKRMTEAQYPLVSTLLGIDALPPAPCH